MVYRMLSDLRILELALHLEETFERYEEYLRDSIPQVPVRAHLAPLFEAGPRHRQLREVHHELAKRAEAAHAGLDAEDVLQTMLDCERLARDFYVNHLDRLSDSHLVELFKDLAQDERDHARIVQEALQTLRRLNRIAVPRSDFTGEQPVM